MNTGLTKEEVLERSKKGLINGKQNVKTKSVARIVREHLLTFFNILYLVIAALMVFLVDKNGKFELKDVANFSFTIVVIVNFVMGLVQELNAKRTIDKLSLLSAPKAIAIRDGKAQEIAIKDIVLDDVLELKPGMQISADCKVIEGEIEVNEAQITGEPNAIEKTAGEEILSGSFVVSGFAKAVVIRVGKDIYTAKISAGVKYIKPPKSEIHGSLSAFIKVMSVVIVPLGVALFCVKYFGHHDEPMLTARTVLGTMIGMIPSGLMMLTSAVFCVSVVRMAKHKTLAQDLYCAEMLARVNVLCLDKTGTITEGKMEVTSFTPFGISEEELKATIQKAVSAVGDDNQTANALKESLGKVAVDAEKVFPFSSSRKWSGAVIDGKAYILGAPEIIAKALTKEQAELINSFAERGERVLGLAVCDGINEDKSFISAPKLLGLVAIRDKIREEAADTLRYFKEQGVAVKIISGDNPVTVSCIAKRVGVDGYDSFVDATTLKDEELADAVQKYTVFGRVTPDMKLKLIKALKDSGCTVAMTGDGVNDVLALKESDCSISVSAGSDAAKNVSQLILLDNNFASLPKVVSEGRRTINNLERSAALYLMKTIYNVLIALIFMALPVGLPFEPKHLTLVGAITIGIPSCVLALEPNKDLVQGRFFSKAFQNALPGAVTVSLLLGAIALTGMVFPAVGAHELSTVSVIVSTIVGLSYIVKISYPFDKVRIALIVSLCVAFVGVFFVDFGFISLPEIFGLCTDMTKEALMILIIYSAISVPIFIGMVYLFKALNKHGAIDKMLVKIKIS